MKPDAAQPRHQGRTCCKTAAHARVMTTTPAVGASSITLNQHVVATIVLLLVFLLLVPSWGQPQANAALLPVFARPCVWRSDNRCTWGPVGAFHSISAAGYAPEATTHLNDRVK